MFTKIGCWNVSGRYYVMYSITFVYLFLTDSLWLTFDLQGLLWRSYGGSFWMFTKWKILQNWSITVQIFGSLDLSGPFRPFGPFLDLFSRFFEIYLWKNYFSVLVTTFFIFLNFKSEILSFSWRSVFEYVFF